MRFNWVLQNMPRTNVWGTSSYHDLFEGLFKLHFLQRMCKLTGVTHTVTNKKRIKANVTSSLAWPSYFVYCASHRNTPTRLTPVEKRNLTSQWPWNEWHIKKINSYHCLFCVCICVCVCVRACARIWKFVVRSVTKYKQLSARDPSSLNESSLLYLQVCPCHHGMARPQVADGGTASTAEGKN